MIATWMGYCALCALWFGLAALVTERILLRGRRPVRYVWAAAVGLSFAVPVLALGRPSQPATFDPGVSVAAATPAGAPSVRADAGGAEPARRGIEGDNDGVAGAWDAAALLRADRPLAVGWMLASSALALQLAGGMLVLARRRRRWTRRDVLGVPVLVSESSGPAVVGVLPAAIVVPAWVLTMDEARLALLLRHEQEHLRVHDGLLLWGAHLAVIAMPWNPALWWMHRRLRTAVELDCDARVLRGASLADVRAYGTLLLDTVWPQEGTAVGVPAFAERADQLDRRIRVMAVRPRHARRTVVLAVTVGMAAVVAACEAPRPRGTAAIEASAADPAGPPAPPTTLTDAALLASPVPGCDLIPWSGRMARIAVLVEDEATPGRVRLALRRARGDAMQVGYAPSPSAAPVARCIAPPDQQIVRVYGREAFTGRGPATPPVLMLELTRPTEIAVVQSNNTVIADVVVDPDTLREPARATVELAWPNGVMAAARRGEVCDGFGLIVDGVSHDRCAPPTPAQLAAREAAVQAARAARAKTAPVAVPAAVGASASLPQAEPAARLEDSVQVARNIHAHLFRGIVLTPAQQATAQSLLVKSTGAQLRLMYDRQGTSPWCQQQPGCGQNRRPRSGHITRSVVALRRWAEGRGARPGDGGGADSSRREW